MTAPTKMKVKPSLAWLAMAIVFLLGGPAGCGVLLVTSFAGIANDVIDASGTPLPAR